MSSYQIKLYTTYGCNACSIMRRILMQVCSENSNIDLHTENIGFDERDINKAKELHISDYPTTRMYKDDNILWELKGTYPAKYIQDCIEKSL